MARTPKARARPKARLPAAQTPKARPGGRQAPATAPVAKKRGRRRNARPVNGLTHQFSGGPAAHNDGVRRANKQQAIADRQQKAWQLFLAGATFLQIGAQLGVSNKTAWTDCMAISQGIEDEKYRNAAVQFVRACSRTDSLLLSHWPKREQEKHAKVIIELLKHQARLLRLGAYGERKDAGLPPPPAHPVTVEIYMPDNGRQAPKVVTHGSAALVPAVPGVDAAPEDVPVQRVLADHAGADVLRREPDAGTGGLQLPDNGRRDDDAGGT